MKNIAYVCCLFICLFSQEKQSKLPVLKSILLPGWGQVSLGDNSGWWFIGAEVTIWSGLLFTNKMHSDGIDDYERFAQHSLELSGSNYSTEFYELISEYDTYAQYVEFQTRQGVDANLILSDENAWQWNSVKQRKLYRSLRSDVKNLKERRIFFFGGMLLNRVVSVVSTLKVLRNNKIELHSSSNFQNKSHVIQFVFNF